MGAQSAATETIEPTSSHSDRYAAPNVIWRMLARRQPPKSV